MKIQLLKFGVVGLVGTAAHYLLLVVLVAIGASALLASSAGMVAGALVNHHLNRHFTFASDKRYRETLCQFSLVASVLFAINLLIMYVLVNWLGWHYLVAQLMATGAVFIAGFVLNKYLVFKV